MIVFYLLDLETNGILNQHEITEFSAIRASDMVQLSRQVRVSRPEDSSLDALKITGKTLDDLRKGLSKSELVDIVEEFFATDNSAPESRCIVGHNIGFDRRFLFRHWEVLDKRFPAHLWLDTLEVMRKLAKKRQLIKPKLSLQASCELLNVKTGSGWHSAKGDTRNCFFLWKELMKEFDNIDFIKTIPHFSKEERKQQEREDANQEYGL
jgi:DNA polymerase III epsilon subunit-like protein